MPKYTVYRNPEGVGYLVDLQADINSYFATRVVAPLLPVSDIPSYARGLNPVFDIEGIRVVMVTQGLAAIPAKLLKHPVMSLKDRQHEIDAAIDLLFVGF